MFTTPAPLIAAQLGRTRAGSAGPTNLTPTTAASGGGREGDLSPSR